MLYLSLYFQKKDKRQSGDIEVAGPDSEQGEEEKGRKGKAQRTMVSEEWTDPWARQSRVKPKKKKNKEVCVHTYIPIVPTFVAYTCVSNCQKKQKKTRSRLTVAFQLLQHLKENCGHKSL